LTNKTSELLEKTLSRPELHNEWVKRYYVGKNNVFYEYAFDYIKETIKLPEDSHILDAGCGNGIHSIRLARRGFRVTAADFSLEALKLCDSNIKLSNLGNTIKTSRENLLKLTFDNNSFDGVLCWGVLMHVPEIELALSELSRIVKPGGYIILCEISESSLENRLRGIIKKLFRIKNTRDEKTVRGLECWTETEAGFFLVRKTNMNWLISEMIKKDMNLVNRRAAQFTELYSHVSSGVLRYIIQIFNEIWFRYIKYASPSLAQILIFRKNGNQKN
jgi:2-polyprenyl-3-methyl-5-hydroxy-6-metoxy-1,4-benzoquinol methylase